MKNLFNTIKMTKPGKNVFDLSHDVKLSGNMGNLIPTLVMECVPGDKFNIGCESLVRFAPLVAPVMHRMDIYTHYFFVPNRLLWPNWEKFITAVAPSPPAAPYLNVGGTLTYNNYGKLLDYMGVPDPDEGATNSPVGLAINALPFAAYQKIYADYYRDQNLVNSGLDTFVPLVDGNNTTHADLRVLRKRAWEHDYFTSALPFAQKGAQVSMPLGSVQLDTTVANGGVIRKSQAAGGGLAAPGDVNAQAGTGNFADVSNTAAVYDPSGTLKVGATTINDLRRAFKLQEWLEKAARGGSRYVENILSHFGVRSPDARLQRAEYITGTKSPVVISEVLNTTGESGGLPQGNMAGHAFGVTSGKYGGYYCQEHGFIIGIMSIMPKTSYQQGIAKQFLKFADPFEYYWPSFAHLGEQAIDHRELKAFDAGSFPAIFGYTPRYAEYKFMPNRVCGEFRESLDYWHLARIFNGVPLLNESFIECVPDNRIFAVTTPDIDHLYIQILHKIRAVRAMPKFGTPSF